MKQVRVPNSKHVFLRVAQLKEAIYAALFRIDRRNDGMDIVIVALFGPSGSGKSSLFNTLTGESYSHISSIERPATKGALCALPSEHREHLSQGLFQTLKHSSMSEKTTSGHEGEVTFVDHSLDQRCVLVDSPDYDTRHDMNREVARRICCWADLVVFVTSVERYADRSTATEFETFEASNLPVIAILNRIQKDDKELRDAFSTELKRNGIATHLILSLAETSNGIDPQAATIVTLKEELAKAAPITAANLVFLSDLIQHKILPDVEQWRRKCEDLFDDLQTMPALSQELQSGAAVDALVDLEESNKFWLRYSPR